MDGTDGLYEITGRVSPCDAYRHLASRTYIFEEFRITFLEDGGFTCVPETPAFGEETASKIEAYVGSFAIVSDEIVTVSVDGRRYRRPDRTSVQLTTTTVSLAPRVSVHVAVVHADGTVSPNPSETAWLAGILLRDPTVAAVALILNDARLAAQKRTRDDYIAFEMMEVACGGRAALASAAGLPNRHIGNLGKHLQVERHRAGYVPTPANFDPNRLHREVHELFLRWAKSRI
jgi:hypothetical protein